MDEEENHRMGISWKEGRRKKEERFILAIDGGGMRGIIPSVLLGHIASDLRNLGDARPLYSHFDLIAGTSTGALMAAALSVPTEGTGLEREAGEDPEAWEEETKGFLLWKRTSRIFRGRIERTADPSAFAALYRMHGRRIFPQNSVSALLGPIFTDKYPSKPYEDLLRSLFGEREMHDLLAPTAFISYDTRTGMIYPITSWGNQDFRIWEAARASSAAPMYFPPFRHTDAEGREMTLIDGGVAANNPSLIAYALSRRLYPDADLFHILSLSTAQRPHTNDGASLGGLTGWAASISGILQDAALRTADITAEAIRDAEYTRIWAPVLESRIKLDDTSPSSLDRLEEAGEKLYEEEKERIAAFCRRMAAAETPDSIRLRGAEALPPPPQAYAP